MSQWNTVICKMFLPSSILGRGKNTSKGLAKMTWQILQPCFYMCLKVLAIKVSMATYIFTPSKNNLAGFTGCFLGEGYSKNSAKICLSLFFATVQENKNSCKHFMTSLSSYLLYFVIGGDFLSCTLTLHAPFSPRFHGTKAWASSLLPSAWVFIVPIKLNSVCMIWEFLSGILNLCK